jgi:hypothetical protein
MIKAKLTGFETAATTLTLAMSRENWNEYVSEKISLGDDCTISFGLPVDALTGITEHEKLESAIAEINRLKEILSMQHFRENKRVAATPNIPSSAMRDQTTSNREAELTSPTAVGSGDLLGIAINKYEKTTD